MNVSIIIVSYNGIDHLHRLLPSIEALNTGGHQVEVILRDDNSTDGTSEWISGAYPWVKLITGTTNLGFAKSNNDAFRLATGDIICLVNGDTILDRDFLIEGIAPLENDPDVRGVNVNMLMPWVVSYESFCNTPHNHLPTYEYQLTRSGYTRYVEVPLETRDTTFLSGGGFFLRRSALKEGESIFDPKIAIYCEDTDLSLRLRHENGRLVYTPRAIMFHNQVNKSLNSLAEFKKLVQITRNRFYIMSKHNSPTRFTIRFPLFVWGIIGKMLNLGLSPGKSLFAAGVGVCLALPFTATFPYWLGLSINTKRSLYPPQK
jgi:N-acetylglucosaminyl-diphospho-decaprenol L-rhamnosyltransferase